MMERYVHKNQQMHLYQKKSFKWLYNEVWDIKAVRTSVQFSIALHYKNVYIKMIIFQTLI